MKVLSERLRELNKVLAAIGKYDRDVANNEIIKKEKVAMPAFYTARKKLQLLGRVSKRDNREVIDPSNVSIEEYKQVGDPYQKMKRRKVKSPARRGTVSREVARKAVKSLYVDNMTKVDGVFMPPGEGKVHETLSKPIELPVYKHKGGAEISISGTADGVIRFIRLLKDGVLG